jgi:transposase-like protein
VAPSKLAIAVEAVQLQGWSAARAARLVGIGSATLRRELQRLGLRAGDEPKPELTAPGAPEPHED